MQSQATSGSGLRKHMRTDGVRTRRSGLVHRILPRQTQKVQRAAPCRRSLMQGCMPAPRAFPVAAISEKGLEPFGCQVREVCSAVVAHIGHDHAVGPQDGLQVYRNIRNI